MIVVKNTDLNSVIKNITVERAFLEGLKENIAMMNDASDGVHESIEKYTAVTNEIKQVETYVKREITSKHSLITTLEFALENAVELLMKIEDKFKRFNIKIFDTATITYQQKGMFDWISTINFFSRYVSIIVDVMLTQPKKVSDYLNKVDMEFIKISSGHFFNVLKRLSGPLKGLEYGIDKLSTEVYDIDEESLIEKIKGREAVTVGLAPHAINPIYWVKYYIMTRNVKTIKNNHEKIDMYAMKLQKLENKRNNAPDPSIDRQIEYWQNQIRIHDAEIAEIEEKYSVNV